MLKSRFVVGGMAVAALAAGAVLVNPTDAHAAQKTCSVNLGDGNILANNGRVNVPLRYTNVVRSQRIVTRCSEVRESVRNAYARYIRQTAGNPLPRNFSTGWYRVNWRVIKRNPQWVRFIGRFQAADNAGQARYTAIIKYRPQVTRQCTTQFNPAWVVGNGQVTGPLQYSNISPFQIDVTNCDTARQSMVDALNYYLAGNTQNPFPTNWFFTTYTVVNPPTIPGAVRQLSFDGQFMAADNPGEAELDYDIGLTQAAVNQRGS